MRKNLLMAFICLGSFQASFVHAQTNRAVTTVTDNKTQQVIVSIPSLKSISDEITSFEAKTAGKEEEYKNAAADLRALRMKYASELQSQIAFHEGKPEIQAVLKNELTKTNQLLNPTK